MPSVRVHTLLCIVPGAVRELRGIDKQPQGCRAGKGGGMSYYEKPEYWCIECGIEINEPGFCYQCKKERKAEYDAEQSERA